MSNKTMTAFDVTCPFCGSHKNEACTSRYGTPLDYAHNRRNQHLALVLSEQKPRQTLVGWVRSLWEKVA